MITQKYNLNLIPDKVPVIVNCSQYDSLSRTIEMTIYDGSTLYSIPSGTTVTVRGTKSDNTGFEYPCTFNGSVVSFDIQDQMTIFAGKVPCEIRLTNNGIIGTCNFLLNVEETTLDPDVTISETDLPLLEEAEQNAIRAEAARDETEEMLSGMVLHGNEVGDFTVPINADQLEGHPASYFQPSMSAGNGISISSNTVSLAQFGSTQVPSANLTNCSGTIYLRASGQMVMIDFSTTVKCTTGGSGWVTLFTLPNGFTPVAKQKFMISDDSTASSSTGLVGMVEAQVTTSGTFQIWAPQTGHNYWGGSMVYIRSI